MTLPQPKFSYFSWALWYPFFPCKSVPLSLKHLLPPEFFLPYCVPSHFPLLSQTGGQCSCCGHTVNQELGFSERHAG